MSLGDGTLFHRDDPAFEPWTVGPWYERTDEGETLPFDDRDAAMAWLRRGEPDETRRIAHRYGDGAGLSRLTDQEVLASLAHRIASDALRIWRPGALGDAGPSASGVTAALVRRLRVTGQEFVFEGERLRIIRAAQWPTLRPTHDRNYHAFRRDAAQARLRKLAEWPDLTPSEQLALREGVDLVAEPRRAPIADGLVLIQIVVRPSVATLRRDPPVTPSQLAREATPGLTWIQIELIDTAGKPVPSERYRVELPDGGIREGTLDPAGRAYIGEIKPGQCRVLFPDIDAEEWRPV
jgi:hypothetical protein